MACGARSGLKLSRGVEPNLNYPGLNGLWSPFGFETTEAEPLPRSAHRRLNGLWSPFGRRRDPSLTLRMTSRELGCMLRVGTRSFAGAQDDRRAAGLDGWDGSEILR